MKRHLLSLFLVAALPVPLHAQTETIINSTIDSTQRDPQIERDAAGNVVVVWNAEDFAGPGSLGDIALQFLPVTGSHTGPDILVNTITAGDQEKPAAAMNGAGDLVIAWASMTGIDSAYDIMARVYHGTVPAGPEFRVNTTWQLTQTEPDVAVDSAGRFVVAWNTWTEDNDRDIKSRAFNADGSPASDEFTVNTTLAFSQARPAVKYFRDGSFVIVWESWKQDNSTPPGYGVYGRRFAAHGTPLGDEFAVNTEAENSQWFADVETFSDNSFVVVWCSWEQDGYDGSIVLQKFASDGSRLGSEVLVNSTTAYYQWLPRVRRLDDDGFAVVWSSWKQDGSREGVYLQLFDRDLRRLSFETRLNATTESFQWEPDLVATGPRQVTAVWSSWGQVGKDYEVVMSACEPAHSSGRVDPRTYEHASGRSTARIVVHVVDSSAVTGQSYEAAFDTAAGGAAAFLDIRNLATGDTVVSRFPIDRGEGTFYLTPAFEGVAVEVIPEFNLDIDFTGSYFINNSGTNLSWSLGYPSAGTTRIAPVDIALIWGSTDTLADGSYSAPLDSAMSAAGGAKVRTPFRAWNLTDGARVDMVVAETRPDKRWNPGEKIIFLTPPAYRTQANNAHGEIRPVAPPGAVAMPAPGDTNMFLTTRPIQAGDRFVFSTTKALILEVTSAQSAPVSFALEQNYPNPFNPKTVISCQSPVAGRVRLVVYDVLGREVKVLMNEWKQPGRYEVTWDASGCASGVYFYRLMAGGVVATKKMLVLR